MCESRTAIANVVSLQQQGLEALSTSSISVPVGLLFSRVCGIMLTGLGSLISYTADEPGASIDKGSVTSSLYLI